MDSIYKFNLIICFHTIWKLKSTLTYVLRFEKKNLFFSMVFFCLIYSVNTCTICELYKYIEVSLCEIYFEWNKENSQYFCVILKENSVVVNNPL